MMDLKHRNMACVTVAASEVFASDQSDTCETDGIKTQLNAAGVGNELFVVSTFVVVWTGQTHLFQNVHVCPSVFTAGS